MNAELDIKNLLKTMKWYSHVGLLDLSSILELSTKLYIKYPWNVLVLSI